MDIYDQRPGAAAEPSSSEDEGADGTGGDADKTTVAVKMEIDEKDEKQDSKPIVRSLAFATPEPDKKRPRLTKVGSVSSLHSAVATSGSQNTSPADDKSYVSDDSKCKKSKIVGDRLSYWVHEMPLQKIVDNQKKYGVQVHQAELALSSMSPLQQRQLQGHINMAKSCGLLANFTKNKSSAELQEALDAVFDDKSLVVPAEILLKLWRRDMEERTATMVAEISSEASLREWLACALPFKKPDDSTKEAKVVVSSMKLWQTKCPPAQMAELFGECFFNSLLVNIISKGEVAMEKMKMMVRNLMKETFS